jgi:hypothetical protein
MKTQMVEYRVATLYEAADVEPSNDWEKFRTVEDARHYANVLVRLGLGAILFMTVIAVPGVGVEQMTEIARFDPPARD